MTGTPQLSPAVQEGAPGCAAIAAGSRGTVHAGASVLAAGGNAADAALAAMLAAPLGEPSLTSMGGGGFMLVRQPGGESTVLDFFVDTPGLGALPRRPAALVPVLVRYPGTLQTFHIGPASVAVPGCVPGLFEAHAAYGRLPLAQVVGPALRMAVDGWPWEPLQVDILELVRDIFEHQPAGRELITRPDGGRIRAGDLARLPGYGRLLAMIAEGTVTSGTSPDYAEPLLRYLAATGGMVTEEDLKSYRVFHRTPMTLHRHGSHIMTNPAPSFGGPIIVDAMARTEPIDGSGSSWSVATHNLIRATEFHRRVELGPPKPRSQQGTTHISVVDGDGMMVSLTISSGAGSGTWVPNLGLHLNNMLGEEDLNPAGFHAMPAGLRIGSMMSPTVVKRDDGTLIGLGTGGSERIRSAIFEVLLRTVDLGMSAADSIVAPRLHPKGRVIQAEPGWPTEVIESLALDLEINTWTRPEVYFGGVHAVMRRPDGSVQAVGDPRRSGSTAIVRPDGTVVLPDAG